VLVVFLLGFDAGFFALTQGKGTFYYIYEFPTEAIGPLYVEICISVEQGVPGASFFAVLLMSFSSLFFLNIYILASCFLQGRA
jgi:hypothetical protein